MESKKKEKIDNKPDNKLITNLVLGGGGSRSASYVGVFQALEEFGCQKHIKNIAGSSAGGLFGFIWTLGFTSQEISTVLKEIKFGDFGDFEINMIENFLGHCGLDQGRRLWKFLELILESKNLPTGLTLLGHFKKTGIRLILTGSKICLGGAIPVYFDYISNPDMRIIDALRITISYPIIFTPHFHQNYPYLDGGLSDNYPIQLFKDDIDNTIGIITSHKMNYDAPSNQIDFIKAIMLSIVNQKTEYKLEHYSSQTVKISLTVGSNFTDPLKLEDHECHMAYEIGYQLTLQHLELRGVEKKVEGEEKENFTSNNVQHIIGGFKKFIQPLELKNE